MKTVYKKTVVTIRRWKENATYYIELQDDTDVSDEDMHEDQSTEEERPNDDSSYCFCRQSSDLDDLIECSNTNCKIRWFHFKCVGVSKRSIPSGDWYCPRCQEMDHWCTCGQPEGDNGKRLIGCSCENVCKIEWYHLNCVGLYDVPDGDWYCDECVETGEAPAEAGNKYCFAKEDHSLTR